MPEIITVTLIVNHARNQILKSLPFSKCPIITYTSRGVKRGIREDEGRFSASMYRFSELNGLSGQQRPLDTVPCSWPLNQHTRVSTFIDQPVFGFLDVRK